MTTVVLGRVQYVVGGLRAGHVLNTRSTAISRTERLSTPTMNHATSGKWEVIQSMRKLSTNLINYYKILYIAVPSTKGYKQKLNNS